LNLVHSFNALKSWQRYVVVTVASFPLALVIRFFLQIALPENLARDAQALVREEKEAPLSEPLQRILSAGHSRPGPSQLHPLVHHEAPDFTLCDDLGNAVHLHEVWRKRPVVLVFYYGYSCPHCVAQLFGLNEDARLFEELGADIYAVSADLPTETAKKLKTYGRFHFAVLSDPDYAVAARYGVYQPPSEGRPRLLVHGTFLIGTDGRIFWATQGPKPFLDNKTLLVEIGRHLGKIPSGPELAAR
jgi:peroxiredoxin Q/BCP